MSLCDVVVVVFVVVLFVLIVVEGWKRERKKKKKRGGFFNFFFPDIAQTLLYTDKYIYIYIYITYIIYYWISSFIIFIIIMIIVLFADTFVMTFLWVLFFLLSLLESWQGEVTFFSLKQLILQCAIAVPCCRSEGVCNSLTALDWRNALQDGASDNDLSEVSGLVQQHVRIIGVWADVLVDATEKENSNEKRHIM